MLTNIKNLLLKPNKVLQSIYIIAFRVLLDYMYCNIVSPLYSYIGMTAEQSTFYYMVSWIMCILRQSVATGAFASGHLALRVAGS